MRLCELLIYRRRDRNGGSGELTRMHLTSGLRVQLRSAEESRWIQSHLESTGCPGNGGYKTSTPLLVTYLYFISNSPILWYNPLILFIDVLYCYSSCLSFWVFSFYVLCFFFFSLFNFLLLLYLSFLSPKSKSNIKIQYHKNNWKHTHFGMTLLDATEAADKKMGGIHSVSVYLKPLCGHIICSLHKMNNAR